MKSFLDNSDIHSNERTLILDLSVIPTKEDQFDDELIFQQLTLLQSQEAIKEKDNDESVVIAARQLKKKVIKLLEKYSSMLTQKDISIRKVIIEDLRIINQEYQELLLLQDEVENISHEVQMIIKLVGEFLQKMKVKQTEKINDQCSKTQPEQQRRTNRINTYEMCSSEPFKKQQSLPQQQQQLSSNSYESDESTTISNKTITALNNKILKIISILQPNMQYNKIINLTYEILNSSENMDNFKHLRQLSKQFDDPDVKKLVKACYLKSLVLEQSQNNTSKREFYDLVIKIKSQVPENNKLHSMMISSLYDEIVKKGVPNSEWETYMKQLCN